MKKIAIHINTINDNIWRLIFGLFDLCHHKDSWFGEEDFMALLNAGAVIRYHEDVKPVDAVYIFGEQLTFRLLINEIQRNVSFFISVVYEKEEWNADVLEILPFVSWLTNNKKADDKKYISLGIDISEIEESQKKRYKYIMGQKLQMVFSQLPEPIASKRCLYYIDFYSESSKKISYSFPYSRQINSAPPSRWFLPALTIDNELYTSFSEVKGVTNSTIINSIKKLDNDLIKKRNFDVSKLRYKSLFEEWLIKAFLYFSSNRVNKDNYSRYYTILHEYYNNIYELIQNIIFHTKTKVGTMSLGFVAGNDLNEDFLLKLPNHKDAKEKIFLVFELSDDNCMGIVETFGNPSLTLRSFFDPTENITRNYDSINVQAATHLGIKSFVSSVIRNGGYFYVESSNMKGGKDCVANISNAIIQLPEFVGQPGTKYRVIIPVSVEDYNSMHVPAQTGGTLVDGYDGLSYRVKAVELSFDNTNLISKNEQEEYIKKYGEAIIDKIDRLCKNEKLENISIDMSSYRGTSNLLLKLIAHTKNIIEEKLQSQSQTNLQLHTLVFYYIDNECFYQFDNLVRADYNSTYNRSLLQWSKRFAIVILSNKMQIRILLGNTHNRFYFVNQKLSKYYTNDLQGFSVDNRWDDKLEEIDNYVLPYDSLVGIPLMITRYVEDELLRKPIEDISNNIYGCKVGIPARLGDKIYIDEFYQADHLFQNSFFAERFAICITRKFIESLPPNYDGRDGRNIIILGYHLYSRLLIEYVKKYLEFYLSRNNIHLKVYSVTGIDDSKNNGIIFQGDDDWDNKKKLRVISIVPIATTLTTFEKLISIFQKQILPSNIIDYNYCVILVRDSNKTLAKRQTAIEKEWGWNEVNNESRVSKTGHRTINYLISKKVKWHHLIDEHTFPPDDFSEEEFVIRTRNASLNVKNSLDYPRCAIPPNPNKNGEISDYFSFTGSRMKELKNYIYYGHILHNDKHHRYYFDIPKYICKTEEQFLAQSKNDRHKPHLFRWMNHLKRELIQNEDVIHVIVTSETDKTPHLSFFLNDHLFKGRAYVVFIDMKDEDIKYKHPYLRQLNDSYKDKIRYYFVDQVIITGAAYYATKSQMSQVLNDSEFKFNAVITIINRLSQHKYNEISDDLKIESNVDKSQTDENDSCAVAERKCNIQSFNHFFIPPCNYENTICYLCKREKFFENLKNNSVITDCRNIIELNKKKYEKTNVESLMQAEAKKVNEDINTDVVNEVDKIFKRMQWQNRVFYEISSSEVANESIEDKEERINKLLDKLYNAEAKINIDDKISFIKAISSPPLSDYARINRYAFKMMLKQLKIVLEKDKPDIEDFILLKVLLKHLALLNSNALVRKAVIIGSWNLYIKVKERLTIEIAKTKKCIQKSQTLQYDNTPSYNIDNIEEYRRRAKEISEYISTKNNYRTILAMILYNRPNITEEKLRDLINDKENKLNQFPKQLLFYIKIATHDDPSKSLWLGELLRTGKEMDCRKYSSYFSVRSTRMYNDLFKSESIGKDNFLLPHLFYDNTTIIHKTLDNFEKELLPIFKGKEDEKGRIYIKDIKELFWKQRESRVNELKNAVINNYYYCWFRLFYPSKNREESINQDNTVDGINFIEKYSLILYARLLLRHFVTPAKSDTLDSFDKNADHLLEVFAKIMDAQAAYITIKPRGEDGALHTLSTYYYRKKEDLFESKSIHYEKNFYSSRLLDGHLQSSDGDFINRGRPFVLRKKLIDDDNKPYGEQFGDKFKRAAYLQLNLPIEKSDGRVVDETVGLVTFLFGKDHQEGISNNRFFKEKQELGRIVLLLKPEIDTYVKHVADEKSFDLWMEKKDSLNRFERVYSNSNHVFNSVFDQMDEFVSLQHDLSLPDTIRNDVENMIILSLSRTWYWLTNEMLSYLYANIERHQGSDGKHYLCLDNKNSYTLKKESSTQDVFSVFFFKMLKALLETRWVGQQIVINGIDVSDVGAYSKVNILNSSIHCNKSIMQTFVVQCLNNSLQSINEEGGHRTCDKKQVEITIDANTILIKDVVIIGNKPTEEDVNNFKSKVKLITEMNCKKYSCTTLTSLQGFVNYMKGQEGADAWACAMGYNSENEFEVKITFNQ